MDSRRIIADLRWGAGWGLMGGVVFMMFAAAVLMIKGGVPATAPGRMSWFTVLGVYPPSGVAAGLIVGLLRQYIETRRAAMLVGMAAAIPASVGFVLVFSGPVASWDIFEVIGILVGAILLGGMGGYILWEQLSTFDPSTYLREGNSASDRQQRGRKERRSKS